MVYNANTSKILILAHTPEPEKICAAAARISTTLWPAIENFENTTSESAGELVSKVLQYGHQSFIEHVSFTIAFENVSAFVEQFMIEFRLSSFTVKSRRYVNFGGMGYYVPDFRFSEDVSKNKKQVVLDLYHDQMNYLFTEYSNLVDSGVPKEDARFLLPYSYKSNFYCTANARELAHIIYSAVSGRGSRFPEIKIIGETLLAQAKIICPNIFDNIENLEYGTEDKELKLRLLFGNNNKRSYSDNACELISHTKDPERVVALATVINHLLYPTEKAEELLGSNSNMISDCLKIACEDKRKRELEQICFTFRINNISLAGLTHLARHRMQSINIPSFTVFGISDRYIIPDTIASDSKLLFKYNSVWDRHKSVIQKFKSLGVACEDLVYLYLSGNLLDVVTTMNARELFHFIQLRSCYRAQWEIRTIAINMLKKLRAVAPGIYSKLGPSCFTSGVCPEGKLNCGKMREVQVLFGRKEI